MPEVIFEIGKNFVTTEIQEPMDVLLLSTYALIDRAKECGATVVKFQVHTVEDEIHPNISITAPHFNQDRYTWVKRNTYPAEFWWDIKEYCKEVELEFLATPMSRGAAELLNEEVGVERWKIGSADILDFVMLDYIRDTGRPIILSSGMSDLGELKQSYNYLKEKANDITILHCVSNYPCALQDLNLNTIPFLKKEFPVKIGLSDHSLGKEAPLMATSMGVEIIEKHFTLDRESWGPDHKSSATPSEMKDIMYRLKNNDLMKPTQEILGREIKYINETEITFRPSFRKGLYASRDLRKDEMFEPDMIISMRPKSEWAESSENYPQLLGSWVKEDTKKYNPIKT